MYIKKIHPAEWDLSYQATCYKRFEDFASINLQPLKNLFLLMEHFPTETYILIYPYLGSISEFSVFITCFTYFSESSFFEDLFRSSIQRLEVTSVPVSPKDTISFTISRSHLFFGVVFSSGLMSGLIGYHLYMGPKTIAAPPEIYDPLKRFRFQGSIGDAMTIFEETTGAVLYTGCNLVATYVQIVVLSFLEPYRGLRRKF